MINNEIDFFNDPSSKRVIVNSKGSQLNTVVILNSQGQIIYADNKFDQFEGIVDYSMIQVSGLYYNIATLDEGSIQHRVIYID